MRPDHGGRHVRPHNHRAAHSPRPSAPRARGSRRARARQELALGALGPASCGAMKSLSFAHGAMRAGEMFDASTSYTTGSVVARDALHGRLHGAFRAPGARRFRGAVAEGGESAAAK